MVEYITGQGPDRWAAASALHGKNFKTDPVIQYLLHTLPNYEREGYIPKFIGTLLKSPALSGGSIWDEAWTSPKPENPDAPPACSAVWLAPGTKVDDWKIYLPAGFLSMAVKVGFGGLKRMIFSFQAASDNAKKEGLRNADGSKIKNYYYLFFISTDVAERGKGLSSELIRRFQVKAEAEGLPIWLESTTANSHSLYLKLGFEDVRTWLLGEGEVNDKGQTIKGGEGVRIWAMLWQPAGNKKERFNT